MLISTSASDGAHAHPALASASSTPPPNGITIRPATDDDAQHLAINAHEESAWETFAAAGGGGSFHEDLLRVRRRSAEAWTGEAPDGSPICMGGAVAVPTDSPCLHSVWFVTAPLAPAIRPAVFQTLQRQLDAMSERYPVIVAQGTAENPLRRRWLRQLGFSLITRGVVRTSGAELLVFRRARHV